MGVVHDDAALERLWACRREFADPEIFATECFQQVRVALGHLARLGCPVGLERGHAE